MGCSIAPLLRYASMTRVSDSLNYSYILPKQTEERKWRIIAKNLGKYSTQKAINRSYSHGENNHITRQSFEILAVMGTRVWRAALLVWFPPHRKKQVLVIQILNSDSQAPDPPCDIRHCFRLHRLCLPVCIMGQQQFPGEPGVKMHYRLQLPLFSSCLNKLLPTKLQKNPSPNKTEKELMVFIPSLSSCSVSRWCSNTRPRLLFQYKKYLSTPTNAVILRSTACF